MVDRSYAQQKIGKVQFTMTASGSARVDLLTRRSHIRSPHLHHLVYSIHVQDSFFALDLLVFTTSMSSPVKLYVYDLSNGLAKQLSLQLTGKQLDGIWSVKASTFINPISH